MADSTARSAHYFRAKNPHLTPAEYRVLTWIMFGLNAKEIAARLGRSPQTIKNHMSNIGAKTGCFTRLTMVWFMYSGNFLNYLPVRSAARVAPGSLLDHIYGSTYILRTGLPIQ